MRKVIGLIPLWDDERESYWMLPGYMKLIEQCGGLPMMLPMTDDEKMLDQALGLCDGLLLTGGHDVSPTLYGQEPLAVCGKPCVIPAGNRFHLHRYQSVRGRNPSHLRETLGYRGLFQDLQVLPAASEGMQLAFL